MIHYRWICMCIDTFNVKQMFYVINFTSFYIFTIQSILRSILHVVSR